MTYTKDMTTTQNTAGRITVKASELRQGDLIHVGGESYVLVADATLRDGKVQVTIYNGTTPHDEPTYSHKPCTSIRLARRNCPA